MRACGSRFPFVPSMVICLEAGHLHMCLEAACRQPRKPRVETGSLGRHSCCAAAMAIIPFGLAEGQFLDDHS